MIWATPQNYVRGHGLHLKWVFSSSFLKCGTFSAAIILYVHVLCNTTKFDEKAIRVCMYNH